MKCFCRCLLAVLGIFLLAAFAIATGLSLTASWLVNQDPPEKADIRVIATPYEAFPGQWWKNQDAARNVVLELTKIIFYRVGGRFYADDSASYGRD